MTRTTGFMLALLLILLHTGTANSNAGNQQQNTMVINAENYATHEQMGQRIQQLTEDHPGWIQQQSLAKTKGGKDLWVITLGKGDTKNRPAIALVANTEGDHLLGTEMALQFAENILSRSADEQITNLMDSLTFYIFPNLNPDASEQYFASLRYERQGNANPTDLDRDGKTGEDPPNDLNNDGLITLMRIEDPAGEWITHPDDDRIMIKADPGKGQKGKYKVLSEGWDDDKDGEFNEDGEQGVRISKNFSYNYPAFSGGAGHHAISETETKALADFLFDAKNVFAVVSFSQASNLSKPLKSDKNKASERIQSSWSESDVKINELVSHLYKKHLKDRASAPAAGSDGDIFQWAYYHYGRFSFSTPVWEAPSPEKKEENQSSSPETDFLKWAEENQLENVFVPWTSIEHPDFPGKKVEVGGIVPFAMQNPPLHLMDSVFMQHTEFILDLASLRPQTDILNLKTEKINKDLFRITADIANIGNFPTTSQIGEKIRWVQKIVVTFETDEKQKIVSGRTQEIMESLDAQKTVERSWLIQGKGTVLLKAGSESTGFKELIIDL
ncbi:MAG: M14 family metallopeptidase [Bacteroidales bacterium]